MINIRHRLRTFWQDETATATLEFVIVFPLLMIVFIAAFETALILTRQVMMERTLDMSVRVLRLSQGVVTDVDTLRTTMCSNTSLLPDCDNVLAIDLIVIDQATYALPPNDEICAERGNDIVIMPANNSDLGTADEFLLIRTCLLVQPMLPFSGFGLNLTRDDNGEMHMIATTVFVNEPT